MHHRYSTIKKRKKKFQGGSKERRIQIGSNDIQSERFAVETVITKASRALSLNSIPETLPCREVERAEIEDFVSTILSMNNRKAGPGKCLYISGIPGTGKTASVLEVIRSFSRESEQGLHQKFHFIEINGLHLPSPQHVYSQLCEALTGETLAPQAAMSVLDEIFDGKSKIMTHQKNHIIVLLDEMDSLVNKSQKILYNLFDWPSRRTSNLSIIGIANTMDLPERLHQRIGSRLAGCRTVFHPYQRDDLEIIMKTRLAGCPIFDKNGVTLAARKVANCSGDVRRCLEICRRAIEIAVENVNGRVEDVRVTVSFT